MTAPSQDTCQPWATSTDVETLYGAAAVAAVDATKLAAMLQVSSTQLFHLCGRQYPGICRETFRPTCEGCSGWGLSWATGQHTSGELLDAVHWVDGVGSEYRRCACDGLSSVRPPSQPVVNVVEIKVDGVAVPPDEYRIEWNRDVVGIVGAAGTTRRWPCWQRMDLADTEVGTFAITYDYGSVIPDGGVYACAALAYNLATATSSDDCELGDDVTSLVRQGVAIQMLDPFAMYPDGLTGVKLADLWLNSLRVGQRRRRATAYRLGSRRHHRTCC